MKGYVYGGIDYATGTVLGDFLEYDPASNTWTVLPTPPFAGRWESTVFTIKDRAYIVGGWLGGAGPLTDECWEWNSTTGQWTQLTPFPGSPGAGGRRLLTSMSISGKGYVGLGVTAGTEYSDMYEFDPNQGSGGAWTQMQSYPASNSNIYESSFTLGNKGYVFDKTELWSYDPTALIQWALVSTFPGPQRWSSTAAAIGCTGFIATGRSPTSWTLYKDLWSYNP